MMHAHCAADETGKTAVALIGRSELSQGRPKHVQQQQQQQYSTGLYYWTVLSLVRNDVRIRGRLLWMG